LVVVLAAVVSSSFLAGEWYQRMLQPAWNPSAVQMLLAWPTYYMLMALSAWMVWTSGSAETARPLAWWCVLPLLNVLWSWLFFDRHRVGWALAVIGLWVVATVISAWVFKPLKPLAASLLLAAAAWLLFTLSLNAAQWRINGGGLYSIFN